MTAARLLHRDARVGMLVRCVEPVPYSEWAHEGLAAGETYRIRKIRERTDDIYLEGLEASYRTTRFVRAEEKKT